MYDAPAPGQVRNAARTNLGRISGPGQTAAPRPCVSAAFFNGRARAEALAGVDLGAVFNARATRVEHRHVEGIELELVFRQAPPRQHLEPPTNPQFAAVVETLTFSGCRGGGTVTAAGSLAGKRLRVCIPSR